MGKRKRELPVIGERFGKWTVIGTPFRNPQRFFTLCACECGNEKEIDVNNLYRGQSTSCGQGKCRAAVTHGESGTPLYIVWFRMKARCQNPNDANFHNYGGRGISVCPEWQEYGPFAQWAKANGYAKGLPIDRRDNDGDYEPNNCRFVTQKINARNTRHNHLVTAWNETKCMAEWAEDPRCGAKAHNIENRLTLGWSPEDAISKSVNPKYVHS